MGRRSRQRRESEKLGAPTTDYRDADGNVLTLRGSMTPATRREYAAVLAGGGAARAAATREDAWQRAVEFLFERLAVRWEIAGAPIAKQDELLARLRFASQDERAWIRGVLREHLAEWFPDVEAP
ncbi:MAG TPA: hypothetical protein VFV85_03425 [Conexibacter sp.]|nr:hypothetical protein [Conexibacter sp.]